MMSTTLQTKRRIAIAVVGVYFISDTGSQQRAFPEKEAKGKAEAARVPASIC